MNLRKAVVPLLVALVVAAWQLFIAPHGAKNDAGTSPSQSQAAPQSQARAPRPAANGSLEHAIASRAERVNVEGRGRVVKVLPDDNDGSRHQRFLVRVGTGTVLIAHNIDLATRVEPLVAGDDVTFAGEYIWNERGGVVHWTHHDPAGRHKAGWIQHDGRRFE